jgi:hypothetical protein
MPYRSRRRWRWWAAEMASVEKENGPRGSKGLLSSSPLFSDIASYFLAAFFLGKKKRWIEEGFKNKLDLKSLNLFETRFSTNKPKVLKIIISFKKTCKMTMHDDAQK